MHRPVFLSLFLLFLTPGAVFAGNAPFAGDHGYSPASLEEELAYLIAPIKHPRDIKEVLVSARGGKSPLNLLSPKARERFLASLRFTERGLSSFDYRPLTEELAVREIYQVLALFGMQRATSLMDTARVESDLDRAILDQGTDLGSAKSTCTIEKAAAGLPTIAACQGDRQGYRCASKGTCESKSGYICTSNC